MNLSEARFKALLSNLVQSCLAPECIDVAPLASGYLAAAHNSESNDVPISERVTSGFSRWPAVAVAKALTEWVERNAFAEAFRRGDPVCQTARSDGIAAYPIVGFVEEVARRRARSNALNEAIERYVWATWWDSAEIAHRRDVLGTSELGIPIIRELLQTCSDMLPVRGFEVVRPAISRSRTKLLILMAHLSNGGVVTGGAAGNPRASTVWLRAASELFRHCLAVKRLAQDSRRTLSFYEERLRVFASGELRDLLSKRLEANGGEEIQLPALSVDIEIKHRCAHFVYVHRCLFERQPPFMGGDVGRLCI